MRTTFIKELIILAKSNPKVVLVVGDLGFGVVEEFASLYPSRFFNAGVAEQNMMGLAAGLASEGFHVFVYSIANFPTFRCAEQIRNDVDYHNLSVTIVSVGGGLAYGNLGYSHHAVQDYSLLRSMPNMLLATPVDSVEVSAVLEYLVENPRPSYLRLGKAGEPNYCKKLDTVVPGERYIVKEGSRKSIILATGTSIDIALYQIEHSKRYSECSLWSLPLWGMKCKREFAHSCDGLTDILVVEDHLVDGGFGSWVMEALNQYGNTNVSVSLCGFDSRVLDKVGSRKAILSSVGLL